MSTPASPFTIFRCADRLFALPADRLERLLRDDEAGAAPGAPLPASVVVAGGEPHAASELGALLHLSEPGASWLLLRVRSGVRSVAMALRTGACVAVRPIERRVAVPPLLFRERGAAFTSAFRAAEVIAGAPDHALGLCLDPDRLWTPRELERAELAIEQAAAAVAAGRAA